MEFSNSDRAQVLVQALPYIKKYTGKVCVIKYGGNAMIDETLKQQVIADKKAAKLIEKYNGKAKDLNGYAQLMNTTVQNDSTAAFASPRFGNLGFGESKVQGAAAAAKVGQLYGPVQGNNSVVYLVVNGENVQGRPFDAKQDGAQFMQMFGINNFFMLLLGDNEIENRSLEFIADK